MIPPTCHFIWLGRAFPWLNVLSVVSAAKAGGFERIVLHADNEVGGMPYFAALRRLPNFEVRRVDLGHMARGAGEHESRVRALYSNMQGPAARSDVLRALILAAEGGVYLDIDTVTVSSFDGLRSSPAFVGEEAICFPEWSTRRHSFADASRAYSLAALRMALRLLPEGHRIFPRFEHFFTLQVNNAVLGSEAGHVFIQAYLEGMLTLSPTVARRPFAVGPDLLARVCRDHAQSFKRLSPAHFYPLPPVIADHWWSWSLAPDLERVLSDETVVVHWYASVRSRALAEKVDAAYVQRHRDRQLFSMLASRYVDAC